MYSLPPTKTLYQPPTGSAAEHGEFVRVILSQEVSRVLLHRRYTHQPAQEVAEATKFLM